MVTKSKKALLASLTAFLCVLLTVFGLSVLSVSSSGTAKADGESAAKIGETSYETLEAAIDAAKENDTIELLNDVSVDSQLVINKAVTLNLGGHTLTSNYVMGSSGLNRYAVVLNKATTVTNGKIVVDKARAVTAYAALTMNKVEVTSEVTGGHAVVALSANNTTYSITNSTIKGNYSVSNFANNAIVTITDSTLIGSGNTLYHNGTNYGLKLTVTNTTITSSASCGVYISGSESAQKTADNQNGVGGRQQATFTKCTISGTNGIEAKYTDLTLDSCTVATTEESSSYTQNNNGPAASGFAVVLTDNSKETAPKPEGKLIIKGEGSYTGLVGLGSLSTVKETYPDFTNDSFVIAVSGGTFSVEVPEEYCEEGYIPQKNEDGTYGVKQGVYVAETNSVKYATLQEAIDAAKSKATVTLLADTKENVTVSKNEIVLDLNGYTLNGGTEKGKPTITVNYRLTIKDSSSAQTGTVKREDTAENSGITSHYVIDIQGKSAFLKVEGGKFVNDSGTGAATKGASLIRVGDDGNMSANPTLTIKGGTFTQDNFIVIKVDHGTLHFLGGELNSSKSYAIENWCNANVKGGTINGKVSSWTYSGGSSSTLEISGGTINGDVSAINYGSTTEKKATVSITGGTVNGTLGTYEYNGKYTEAAADKATIEVTAGTFSKDPSKYLVANSTITTDENGNYGVTKAYLAKVGETSYYTMDEAFKAQTASGKEIVLLRDYTSNDVFNSGSINRTVNLNGFTWTYTGTDIDCAAFEVNYSDVVLTVKNGKIVSSQLVGLIPSAMSGSITYDNAEISFESVVMTANGHSGIETNGNNTNDRITLKDSTLNVPNGFGIYFPSSGMLTIENSVINAKTMGVQVCSGSLNISGDKTAITVTGNAVPKTENDGAIQDGAAISIVGRAGYKGLVKAEIAGGTFTSADGNAIKAYEWANKEESKFDNSASVVEVTGGVFSGKVDKDLLRCGYILNTVGGNSTVKEGKGFTEVRVVLNESLAMKLMLDKAVTSNYVVVTYTSLEDGNAKTVTLNDHGDYYLFDKIMPQMIDVKFTFELYGDDGVMLDRIANYSIIDYLGNVLKTNAGSTEAFKNLAASLIEYANKAKAVKGLDTISPIFYAKDGKTEIELNYAEFVKTNKIPAKETASSVSTGSVQAIYKAKVVFDNAYTLYFYADTAKNYTYKLDEKEITFDENGIYGITVKANEITKNYVITVYDNENLVQTVTYGVSIYSIRMQETKSPDGELYVATYYYGIAVNKYAGV